MTTQSSSLPPSFYLPLHAIYIIEPQCVSEHANGHLTISTGTGNPLRNVEACTNNFSTGPGKWHPRALNKLWSLFSDTPFDVALRDEGQV